MQCWTGNMRKRKQKTRYMYLFTGFHHFKNSGHERLYFQQKSWLLVNKELHFPSGLAAILPSCHSNFSPVAKMMGFYGILDDIMARERVSRSPQTPSHVLYISISNDLSFSFGILFLFFFQEVDRGIWCPGAKIDWVLQGILLHQDYVSKLHWIIS